MKKRVLAALLAGMMSLSLVAGCGSTQETGGEASSSAGTEAGSAAEAVSEEASAETAESGACRFPEGSGYGNGGPEQEAG